MTKIQHLKQSSFGLEFNAQNYVMENLCVWIWNQSIRINSKTSFSFMLP